MESSLPLKIDTKEKYITLLACATIGFSPLLSLVIQIIRMFVTLPYKIDTILVYFLLVLLVLKSLNILMVRIKLKSISMIFFILFSLLVAFFYDVSNTEIQILLIKDFILICVPSLVIFSTLKDFKILYKYLIITSIIIVTSVFFNVFIFPSNAFSNQTYHQEQSYLLLLPILTFLNAAVKNKNNKILYILLFLSSLLLLISMGSRGPLLSIVLYSAFIMCFQLYKRKKTILIFISFFILIYVFRDTLTFELLHLFDRLGLSTRVFDRIIASSFFADESRISLYKRSILLIVENPVLGIGLGNDRMLLSSALGISDMNNVLGLYVHNIFLEILLAYGIFIGGFIIVFWSLKIIKAIKRKNESFRHVYFILFFSSIIPLFVSGSFIASASFFALIGITLSSENNSEVLKKHE